MPEYVIFTDATVDLTDAFVESEKIGILPMEYTMDGATYTYCRDWKEEQYKDFYAQLRAGKVATTSQITPFVYATTFEPVLQSGKDVLYICFSSGLSGTIESARLVASDLMEKYPGRKVICVDSLGATFGEGLAVITAAQKRAEGADIETCAKWVEDNLQHNCHWFTVDDLMFLKRGGRISATTAIVGSALQIKPVMHMDKEGHLIPVEKVRGRKLSLKGIANRMKETAIHPEEQEVYIGHGDSLQDAEALASRIREIMPVRNIYIAPLSPIIGSHSGPGTIALFFLGTQR